MADEEKKDEHAGGGGLSAAGFIILIFVVLAVMSWIKNGGFKTLNTQTLFVKPPIEYNKDAGWVATPQVTTPNQ